MTIYRGVNGINREIKEQFRGVGGVNREIKEQYRGVGGVNRQVFNKGIGGIDNYTKLILHCDDFTDSSGNNRVFTNNGVLVDSIAKFNKSLNFNGNAYMSTSHVADYDFGTENFTIDFWMYCNESWLKEWTAGIISHKANDNTNGWVIYRDSTSTMYKYMNARLTLQTNYLTASTPSTQVWEHWALVRNGTNLRWYKNGVVDSEYTISPTLAIQDRAANMVFGTAECWDYKSNIRLDEVRISKGIARWSANFTPPTEPYS